MSDIQDFEIKNGVLEKYIGNSEHVVIPPGVTVIEDRAFKDSDFIISEVILDGVAYIGEYAFWGCKRIKSLMIPDSVTEIESSAFANCSGLTSIEVSDDNKVYYSENNCIIERGSKKLVLGCQSSIIPDDVTEIAMYAFYGCAGLGSIVIPDSVTKIGWSAFSYCTGLESIVIPDSATNIGMYAFRNCSGLTSIIFGKNVKYISMFSMFDNCSSLTSVEIRNGNERYYSQNNCVIERATKKLILGCKSSIIPDDVTAIGVHAFDGCIELTSIVIPENATKIEEFSFRGCKALESIVIPGNVTTIGKSAFSDCTGLASVVISEGVTEIENHAFCECTALKSVVLPKSLKKLEYCAFRNSGVESVTYAGARSEFNAIERTEWNRASKITTVVCLGGEDVEISEHDQWLELITRDDAQDLKNAPEHILADKDFVLKAVKRNGNALEYASNELKSDAEVVLAAIEGGDDWGLSAEALEFASDELKDDESIVMIAVSRYGEALRFASDRLRCDRDVVMAAVDQSGWALQYASDELRNDEEVVLTAIQGWDGVSVNYSYAMEYASEELRSNKEFMRKAIELTQGEAFSGATEELKNDKEMVLFAVRHCSLPHQCDPDIVLRYASEEMRADRDVVIAAAGRNAWSLAYASPALLADKEFILEVVKIVGEWALDYIDETLRNDADVLEAVKRHVPPSEER